MSAAELGAADIAIIGGGLVGCATAYYLARAGKDVALLERGQTNREASGTNAGSLHLQIYIHPHFPEDWIESILPSVALLRESASSWATMEAELKADCGIRLGGGLWVAETDEEMALIERKVVAENSMGVCSAVHSRAGMLELAPYLGSDVIGGSFLAGEGFANPLLVTPAYRRTAAGHGARFHINAGVRSIEREADGRFVLVTDRGAFRARQVVTTAGAWTPQIARMVGLDIPITGGIAQVNVTEGRPMVMFDHLLQHVGMGLTLKQSPTGTFIIGGGWPGAYDRPRDHSYPHLDSIIGNTWVAARTVPAIGDAQLVRSWGGMGSGTPDGLPVIGESSRVPGFSFVYAPLGFTMGPICAQVYSEHVLTGAPIVPIAPFSPDRYLA